VKLDKPNMRRDIQLMQERGCMEGASWTQFLGLNGDHGDWCFTGGLRFVSTAPVWRSTSKARDY
jgi:hypothetical protein